MPMPPVASAVTPHRWLSEYWRAWWTLHPGRPKHGGGMGPPVPSPIPWRDVMAWADRHPHLDPELLSVVVAEMDETFLGHWTEVARADAERQRRESERTGRRGRR